MAADDKAAVNNGFLSLAAENSMALLFSLQYLM
jgi:hypothetical protein